MTRTLTEEERKFLGGVYSYLFSHNFGGWITKIDAILDRLTAPDPQQPDSCPPRQAATDGTGVGSASLPVAEATTARIAGDDFSAVEYVTFEDQAMTTDALTDVDLEYWRAWVKSNDCWYRGGALGTAIKRLLDTISVLRNERDVANNALVASDLEREMFRPSVKR